MAMTRMSAFGPLRVVMPGMRPFSLMCVIVACTSGLAAIVLSLAYVRLFAGLSGVVIHIIFLFWEAPA